MSRGKNGKNLASWSFLALAALGVLAGYTSQVVAQKAEEKVRRPRLPNYYAQVVNDEQRAKINEIQDEYQPQLAKLRDELKTLVEERDAAIEKVLTADQRKQVDTLRAEAAAKRRAGTASAPEAREAPRNTKSKAKKAA